jgi:ubiquinone/menaquinone biosynthesis C-methylase UbiE
MGKYTVVTAIHTLEHLVDTAAVLKRIHDLLRPGGVFCGIVPNINSLCSHAYEERWQWLDTNTHYVHFTPATLRAALLQFGFEVLQTSTCTGDYDQAELLQLLEKKADRKLAGNDLAKALKETWAAGSGEEIHFFACKKLT